MYGCSGIRTMAAIDRAMLYLGCAWIISLQVWCFAQAFAWSAPVGMCAFCRACYLWGVWMKYVYNVRYNDELKASFSNQYEAAYYCQCEGLYYGPDRLRDGWEIVRQLADDWDFSGLVGIGKRNGLKIRRLVLTGSSPVARTNSLYLMACNGATGLEWPGTRWSWP